ncbi:unnamed protein product [Coregonus sp. 'balchen']|nr:unnamed protein product [Coregonus sp. 'balchen']
MYTAHMLAQLQKFTRISRAQTADAIHWSLNGGSGTTAVKTVSLATVKKNVRKLTDEMPLIQQQMKAQSLRLQHVGKTLQDTEIEIPDAFL